MPKMKTRKGVAKRVKKTGTGKYMHSRAGNRHILTKKNRKRKRRLRQDGEIKHSDMKRIKAALPYG